MNIRVVHQNTQVVKVTGLGVYRIFLGKTMSQLVSIFKLLMTNIQLLLTVGILHTASKSLLEMRLIVIVRRLHYYKITDVRVSYYC